MISFASTPNKTCLLLRGRKTRNSSLIFGDRKSKVLNGTAFAKLSLHIAALRLYSAWCFLMPYKIMECEVSGAAWFLCLYEAEFVTFSKHAQNMLTVGPMYAAACHLAT